MKKILAIALFLAILSIGKAENVMAASPQCGGEPQYYTCSQLTGQAAGAPDSVTDIGPMLTCQNITPTCQTQRVQGEQCRVTWNNPPYTWTAWALPGTSCNQFWNAYLGVWTYWGANMPTHTGVAPAGYR